MCYKPICKQKINKRIIKTLGALNYIAAIILYVQSISPTVHFCKNHFPVSTNKKKFILNKNRKWLSILNEKLL